MGDYRKLDGVKRFTVKFLNLWMPESFAVIYIKFKERGQNLIISSKRCK